jgi:hypothetical protein
MQTLHKFYLLPDVDVVYNSSPAEDDAQPDDDGGDNGRGRVEVHKREQHDTCKTKNKGTVSKDFLQKFSLQRSQSAFEYVLHVIV